MDNNGWLPIESAPKDGNVVRLYDPRLFDGDFNFYFDGHWTDCREDGLSGWVGPWWNACQDYWAAKSLNPTHWQPLPPPPGMGCAE